VSTTPDAYIGGSRRKKNARFGRRSSTKLAEEIDGGIYSAQTPGRMR